MIIYTNLVKQGIGVSSWKGYIYSLHKEIEKESERIRTNGSKNSIKDFPHQEKPKTDTQLHGQHDSNALPCLQREDKINNSDIYGKENLRISSTND